MNGRYCQSGLAYPVNKTIANCTTATGIKYAGKSLVAPYKCDPDSLSIQCQIMFNITSVNGTVGQQNLSVPCGCGLDGNSGYCSKLLGMSEY
jgi:hypothetical protein